MLGTSYTPKWIGEFREEIIESLVLGHAVEVVFGNYVDEVAA